MAPAHLPQPASSVFWCFVPALWTAKWTLLTVSRHFEGVDTPKDRMYTPTTNALPAAWIKLYRVQLLICYHKLVRTIVAGGSETQNIKLTGIGKKQMGQSSLGGGLEQRLLMVARQYVVCILFLCLDQWFFWHLALQYLTSIHDLRLSPPSSSV